MLPQRPFEEDRRPVPYTPGQRLALALVPRAAALLIRLLGSTLRFRNTGPAPVGDELPGPSIFVFPHRSLLVCAHRFQNRGIAILISRSFDGELIARTVERLGFLAIRGSSSRGGSSALRQMAAAYAQGRRCAITTDGPRGPAMVVKPGAEQLAALVQAPWVGAFYARPSHTWTLNTWDRFLIPKPFSTVTVTWPDHALPYTPEIQAALDKAVALATP